MSATSFGCEPLAAVDPQVLGLTYWFEAAREGEPYTVTIRFTGRRRTADGKPGQEETFSVLETVDPVLPGSGRIAITARVHGIAPGTWDVSAAPIEHAYRRARSRRSDSGRRLLPSTASASATTGWGPVIDVRAPGARLGVWSALVGLGVVIAIVLQAVLAARAEMDVAWIVPLSLVASLAGLAGAKLYFLALHRRQPRGLITTGLCLQGFVLGAVGTAIVGALVLGISPGVLLDVTAPGLLFALAVGRIGCFLGGCCAGRPTASRWGLWSSDRRLSTRRIPTQLFESTLAGSLGVVAIAIAWMTMPRPAGALFVATFATYTLGRQLVLPFRDIPRKTARGRIAAIVITGAILIADITLVVLL